MAGYAPLPAYQAPNALNFQPLSQGIDDLAGGIKQGRLNALNQQIGQAAASGDWKGAQNAAFGAGQIDQGLGLAKYKQQADAAALDHEQKVAQHTAGISQMVLSAPPDQGRAMMQKLYQSQPDIAQHLARYGVDPSDHQSAAKFMIAEARGYVNPLEEQLSRAQLEHAQGQIALLPLQKQQMEQGIAQGAQKQQLLKVFLQGGQASNDGVMDPRQIMALEAAGVLSPGAGKVATEDPRYQQQQRMKAAQVQGLDMSDPATKEYVLTGSYPKIEKNYPAISKADDAVLDTQKSLDTANKAIELNKNTMQGPMTGWRASVGGWMNNDQAKATQQYETFAKMLSQEIAKGNSIGRTNATEQQLMAKLVGGVDQPRDVREAILKEVQTHLADKHQLNVQRANELRTGTYYRPGHQQGAQQPANASQMSDEDLKAQLGIK